MASRPLLEIAQDRLEESHSDVNRVLLEENGEEVTQVDRGIFNFSAPLSPTLVWPATPADQKELDDMLEAFQNDTDKVLLEEKSVPGEENGMQIVNYESSQSDMTAQQAAASAREISLSTAFAWSARAGSQGHWRGFHVQWLRAHPWR